MWSRGGSGHPVGDHVPSEDAGAADDRCEVGKAGLGADRYRAASNIDSEQADAEPPTQPVDTAVLIAVTPRGHDGKIDLVGSAKPVDGLEGELERKMTS